MKTSIVVSPARTLREGLRHCHQMTRRLARGDGRSGERVPPIAPHMPADSHHSAQTAGQTPTCPTRLQKIFVQPRGEPRSVEHRAALRTGRDGTGSLGGRVGRPSTAGAAASWAGSYGRVARGDQRGGPARGGAGAVRRLSSPGPAGRGSGTCRAEPGQWRGERPCGTAPRGSLAGAVRKRVPGRHTASAPFG